MAGRHGAQARLRANSNKPLLPTTTKIGAQASGSCPPPQPADPPSNECPGKEIVPCCKLEDGVLLTPEEYSEWLDLHQEVCLGTPGVNSDRYRDLSRRLHVWRDGFTSDSGYEKWRGQVIDRSETMGAWAAGLSEFVGTFAWTFLPVLIISTMPAGYFDVYGALGPAIFALCALIGSIFSTLYMHGAHFEPTTTLLLFWFSDDWQIKKRRNFWPTFGRIVAQFAAVFIACALLLIMNARKSDQYDPVAQIADIQTYLVSGLGDPVYNLWQNIFATFMCGVIYKLGVFAVIVIARSTIKDFISYQMIVPVLISLLVFGTMWGTWNVSRASTGSLKWLATNSVLVGKFAYGTGTGMSSAAWIFPVFDLVSHIAAAVFIMFLSWLYRYSGLILVDSQTRAGARPRTKN